MGRWIKKDGVYEFYPWTLKFYEWERKTFPKIYGIMLKEHGIELLYRKLKRRYKINQLLVVGEKRKNGACSRLRITVPDECSLGMLAHEVAHAVDFKKRQSKHDKKFKRIMVRVFKYCEKMDYWGLG